MKKPTNLLIALFGLTSPLILAQIGTPRAVSGVAAAEQRSFSAEDENVRRPIPLAPEIARILAKDPGVREIIKNQDLSPAELPPSWFLASEVHLNGPKEKDVLVIGQGPIQGANITAFWVLRPGPDGFELILNTYAHDLIVKDTRSRGYRDIQVMRATAVQVSTTLYKFDGGSYKVSTESSSRIP
jgi:hypothetical protein